MQMDSPPRPELFDFHGVPMTHYFTDSWENVQNFQARPDDILIVTYPKAGSNWVSFILDLLHFDQKSLPIHERVPLLEATFPFLKSGSSTKQKGTDMADNLLTSPRLIRTHLPVQFVPKSFWEQNSRIVYIVRNGKDSVVSFFHFQSMSKLSTEPGDWSSYLQRFMEGKLVFGSWYDHVNSWWEKKQTYSNLHYMFFEDLVETSPECRKSLPILLRAPPLEAVIPPLQPVVFGSWYDHVNSWWEKKQTYSNLHYMFFEDLVEDTGREIDKLCCFLGLSPSAEETERLLDRVHFDNMEKDKVVNYSASRGVDDKVSPFIRKGKVGDWKNHFTVAQSEEFDEDYKKKMKNPTLKFRTEI
ncbi:hypothetical protein INR49_013388 [Caranx melampygus]|nr:hypothetical protein INR49_013388 [Caranx melampygus]